MTGLRRTALLSLLMLSVAPAPSASGRVIQVFCSIAPQAYIIERVGGPLVSVHVMVGPGQSPHTFAPTPRQMAELAEAAAYFSIGLPFERELLTHARGLNPGLRIVDMARGIALRHVESGHDHGAGRARGNGGGGGLPDPHIWLDPLNAGAMATTVHDALVTLAPDESDALDVRYAELERDLAELYDEISAALEPLAGRRIYVFHPAFGYFTDAFGLVQVPVEVGGTEPSARELAALMERARSDSVRVIFVQPQFSHKSAAAIASEIGGVVVPIDPLSPDYIESLRNIAKKISESLGAPAAGCAEPESAPASGDAEDEPAAGGANIGSTPQVKAGSH
jgi:zinc transport system substrate-binding protein